ncbi:MAG: 2,3,4,5-tetrahydropyridine-2,6-dicarboxylate N-succinyltransferase [Pseudomonadota bacterium]
MFTSRLEKIIDEAWERRNELQPGWDTRIDGAVEQTLDSLDNGKLRVAEKIGSTWQTHQWIKKAVLLSFRLRPNVVIQGGPDGARWWDKIPSKFSKLTADNFNEAGYRAVPGAVARHGSYIGKNCVVMPSFINIGAYVGDGTMVDTWVTIGSCAQIGRECHISGGVGIGGVLEPLQANPVIIGDNCFIGARSEVAEGVIVGDGAVISMGVFLGASTKIVDRETGAITYGEVPPYAVVVPGTLPSDKGGPSLACAVIVKRVDEKTRSKTSINELLRA